MSLPKAAEAHLPVLRGVGPSAVTLPPGAWPTLLEFLAAHFPSIGRETWHSRLQRGLVLDANGGAYAVDAPFRPGAIVHYYRELPPEPVVPFEEQVLFQDEHILVADKPHFLPVMPAGRFLQQTLLVRLNRRLQLPQLTPLHRLDRGTAGLVLFSVNPETRARYQALFARREMVKLYEALAPHDERLALPLVRRSRLVKGEMFFCMREAAGTPNSETHVELAERRGALSLYRLRPVTGKQHQLRVHLAALGIPIVNDALYPVQQRELEDDYSRPMQLLARGLEFVDPLSGERRTFESPRRL